MSRELNDLTKLIICLKRKAWHNDAKLNHYIVNVLTTFEIKYKKLKKENEQAVEMKFYA